MRYLSKVLVFISLFLTIVANSIAQDITKGKNESKTVECKKCDLADGYDDYIQIESKKFSFCIPNELKEKKIQCVDSFCKKFESERMVLVIDTDPNAGIPVLEKTYLSYTEESILIDSRKVWLWYFEQDQEYKYVSGANFWSEKQKYYDFGTALLYKDSDQKKTAEKIIKSFRFK